MTNEASGQSLSEPLVLLGKRFRNLLAKPIDAASLAVFRICFGLIMVYEAFAYLRVKDGANRVQGLFSHQHWHFPYHGFEWVTPWSETGMHIHFWLLGVLGLCVALGMCYRVAATGLFFVFTYIFLLDAALYLNHFYLMCLICFLLIWMPAHRCWSVDGWWKRRTKKGTGPIYRNGPEGAAHNLDSSPSSFASLIPFWPLFLLRAQMFIVYFYAGIAKLSGDWLSGDALRAAHQKIFDFLDGLLPLPAWLGVQELGLAMNWGGMLYDLSVGFLLICRRTRLLGFVLSIGFHTINHFTFPIGVFPVMALTASLLFFEPDWPRTVWAWVRRPRLLKPDRIWLIAGALALPVVGATLGWKRKTAGVAKSSTPGRLPRVVLAFVAVWIVVQCAIPLRHFWVEGNPEWTEENHRFSWRMMLKSKAAVDIKFDVDDKALLSADSQGRPQLNWEHWPDEWPRVMFVTVDCYHVPWSKLPNIVCLYEPYVGVRVIENPLARKPAGDGSVAARRGAIRKQWKEVFGREPEIRSTTDLATALDAIRQFYADDSSKSGVGERDREILTQCVDIVAEVSKKTAPKVADMLDFSDALQVLVDRDKSGFARDQLARTHPFAVQGSPLSGPDFLVVEDRQIEADTLLQQLSKLHGDAPYSLLIDTNRLRYKAWNSLPPVMLCLEMGQPRLMWNCFHEMHQRQVQVMTRRPYMAHQYANRIAKLWQQATGRRPGVYVTAIAKLNQRKPQLIIDPSVDLASVPLRMVGHNEWIYQANSSEAQLAPPQVASATPAAAGSETAAAKPQVLDRYSSGAPKKAVQWQGKNDYTVISWHENGQMAMLAQYKNDQPHGKQMKWIPEGTLTLEMHFQNGKPHGLAQRWDVDGQLLETAQFIEGRKVNSEDRSNSTEIPAIAEQPASGSTHRTLR